MTERSQTDFGARVAGYMPNIWKYAVSLSGRPDVADDLTQATCLRALEKRAQFTDGTSLIAWLVTICRSIWLNELRAKAVRKTSDLDSAPAEALISTAPDTETNIFASQVFSQLMTLPEAQRETAYLVYVEQFTYRETAEMLGIPIGTVMSRLATARARLAHLAAPDEDKEQTET